MSKDEIVTALRICASGVDCAKGNCTFLEPNGAFGECTKKKNTAAADLIENQPAGYRSAAGCADREDERGTGAVCRGGGGKGGDER